MSPGMWGTQDANRVAVTLTRMNPREIVAYVVLKPSGLWAIENAPDVETFLTAEEAARAALERVSNGRR